MSEQIKTIKSAVEEALTTVSELHTAMESISNAATSITKISQQTNLLALNAAIESARAGTFGKGFSVVADKVKMLAEQSGNASKKIYDTILAAREKSEKALLKVREGNIAVASGSHLVSEVNLGYEQISNSFNTMDNSIGNEYEMTNKINALYSDIQSNLDNIASIVEEHAAAIEEISSITESQNINIIEVSKISKDIDLMSKELSKVLDIK